MAKRKSKRSCPIISQIDIGRGAACMDCRRPFRPGDSYAERLIGFIEDTPLTEVICTACDYPDVTV
jgi:hypothetical protein